MFCLAVGPTLRGAEQVKYRVDLCRARILESRDGALMPSIPYTAWTTPVDLAQELATLVSACEVWLQRLVTPEGLARPELAGEARAPDERAPAARDPGAGLPGQLRRRVQLPHGRAGPRGQGADLVAGGLAVRGAERRSAREAIGPAEREGASRPPAPRPAH